MSVAADLVLQQLREGQCISVQCVGDSMTPTIARDEVVVVRGVRHPREVHRGDVILFALEDRTLEIHRVTAHLGKWVWHRGDYHVNPRMGRVPWSRVYGLVFGYSKRQFWRPWM